jgi:hypothetical protein
LRIACCGDDLLNPAIELPQRGIGETRVEETGADALGIDDPVPVTAHYRQMGLGGLGGQDTQFRISMGRRLGLYHRDIRGHAATAPSSGFAAPALRFGAFGVTAPCRRGSLHPCPFGERTRPAGRFIHQWDMTSQRQAPRGAVKVREATA